MERSDQLILFIFGIIVLFPYANIGGSAIPIIATLGLFLPLTRLSQRETIFWVALSIIIFGYALAAASVGYTQSVAIIKSLIALFFIFALMSILINRLKISSDKIISLILCVGVINAGLSIGTTLVADLRIIYEFIAINPKFFSYPIPRYPGLVYDGFSYLSIFYALIYLLCLQLWLDNKISNYRFFYTSLMMVIGILLSGRFGLLIALIGTFIIFCTGHLNKLRHLLMMGLGLTFPVVIATQYSSSFAEYFAWNVTAVFSVLSGNFNADTSVVELVNSHFFIIGKSFADFLFGTFDFGYPGGSYTSDVGWIRIFNGSGVFGVVSFLVASCYFCTRSKYLATFTCVLICGLFKDWYFMFPYYFWAIGFALYFASKSDSISK